MGLFKREKKYILYADKKKYTEKQLIAMSTAGCITGISLHKAVNEIYETQLTEKEKEIVKNYYDNLNDDPDSLTGNYLKYVPFLSIADANFTQYLHGVWSPLIEYNHHRAEQIVYYIIENYLLKDANIKKEEKILSPFNFLNDIDKEQMNIYQRASLHHGLALLTYKRCEKTPENLVFVAEHGLEAYKLKDSYFKKDNCVRLDFFWTTLCNVLKTLGRYDEAIEIATFGYENDAFDNTKGGWEARLEKLIKAKQKATIK